MKLTTSILNWYDASHRKLPWRETKAPYSVWISEIILQQTRVSQGLPYYHNFIQNFPSVQDLAQANLDDVLASWKGLGYYSRAINLHQAARQVVHDYGGVFPTNFRDLQQLKGVGKYTAAAIASICYGEKVPAIDGNFYRVFSRFFADDFDISSTQAHRYFSEMAAPFVDAERPGDFNQAVMDLGATICTPKNPDCGNCPLASDCLAYQLGKVALFPVKKKKVKVENLNLKYFFVFNNGRFLVKRRDAKFIWKNLYEFPTDIPKTWSLHITSEYEVKHKLTHKNLKISFAKVEIEEAEIFEGFAANHHFKIMNKADSSAKSFPKPLEEIIEKWS